MGLPLRFFLYTVDQVASALEITPERMSQKFIYFDRRSVGIQSIHQMLARNVAPVGEEAEWRIAEKEVIRWLRVKGFKVVQRRYVEN